MNDADEYIPTRSSLLGRLKDLGDQESWRLFFDTYWKLIYRAAREAKLTEAEAEDVVQETVISVSKSIHRFDYDPQRGSFKTYLMRLTAWRIVDQRRKRLPVKHPAQAATGVAYQALEEWASPVPPELEALWNREWEQNLIEAALRRTKEKTDPKLYQVFDLYVNKNWPVSKVARDLRVTKARVYLAKHLVGKRLKKELEKLRKEPV